MFPTPFSRRTLAVVAVLAMGFLTLHAQERKPAGTKYAFLVACSGYDKTQFDPLPYTINDIEEFKKALLETGFEDDHIVMMHDKLKEGRYHSEAAKIRKELQLLLAGMRPEDMVVVALSGHGVHFKGGATSYFCPVDADLDDPKTLLALDGMEGLFSQLKGCGARQKLLLVNACRSAPARRPRASQAATKVNLDDDYPEVVPEGIAALYSCVKGQESYYDDKRQRGVFFLHATEAWRGKYHKGAGPLTLEQFFSQVQDQTKNDVRRNFGKLQIPEVKRQTTDGGVWVVQDFRSQRGAEKAAEAVKDGSRDRITNSVGMEFVYVKPGRFQMGSPATEHKRDNDETQHWVRVKGFYLQNTLVTQKQWQAVMGAGNNPSKFQGDDLPVDNVSHDMAKAYCAKLTQMEGQGRTYRLPYEAEWEYAARAGTTTPFWQGETINTDQVNYDGNYPYRDGDGKGEYRKTTTPVKQFKANPWGFYDMGGNLWQWCEDWYGPYPGNELEDYKGLQNGTLRVLRGGSWLNCAWDCRAALRNWSMPATRLDGIGFRLAFRLD